MADSSQVKEITEKLEQGVKDLFNSDTYTDYLKTMSRFHQYSTRNTLLIHMQKPDATLVAGFVSWKTKFERHVKKDEKSIKILAPVPFTKREEKELLDPDTRKPILDENGMPVVEVTEQRYIAKFNIVNVYDVSQTDGKPLPSLVQNLTGNVEQYAAFMDTLRAVSPLPIVFEPMEEGHDGTCRFGEKISIREGMSEIQTVCAVIHEITHAKLHDIEALRLMNENAVPKDRRTEEIEAESVSFSVCSYYNIETGANSFGYLAEWSKGRELKELNASLDTIRKTAAELIDAIDSKFREITKDRDITFAIGEQQVELTEPLAVKQDTPAPEANALADRPTPGTVYAQYCNQIVAIVKRDETYANAFMNSDEQNARTECDAAVKRAVIGLFAESENHIELFRQYADNPDFKARIEDYVFIRNYYEPLTEQRKATKEGKNNAMEHKLYEKFAKMFPQLMNGEYSSMRLEAEHAKPLELEWVFGDHISMSHTYELNGKPAYEPMIVFIVNSSDKTMTACELEVSEPPRNDVVYNDKGRVDVNMQRNINNLAIDWLDRAEKQGFKAVSATVELDNNGNISNEGLITDKTVRITFDKDGNPIMPQQEKNYEIIFWDTGMEIEAIHYLNNEDNDYDTLAYISYNRSVEFAEKGLSDEIKAKINIYAQKAEIPNPVNNITEQDTSEIPGVHRDGILNLSLPDPTIGFSEMNLYGYAGQEMLPLLQSRAVELFDADHCIYLLYPDNTEAMALDRDEILNHDGLCGIENADWERSPVRAAQLAVAASVEGSRESELLYGDGNRFGIYQIRDGIEEARNLRFSPIRELEAYGLSVNRANYELVYTAPFSERIESLSDRFPVLNKIYEDFNTNHPSDFTGHSLSVSDVVVLKYGNNISSHFVDSTGYVALAGFLGNESQQAIIVENPMNDKGLPTLSQVGTRSDEHAGASAAQLESDANSGKVISLTDLANAIKTERKHENNRGGTPKIKPTLMERLDEGKRKAAAHGGQKSAPMRETDKEVRE